MKDFVPDHPHLHELVDKTHQGDLDAKHRFERESLSVRCKYDAGSIDSTASSSKKLTSRLILISYLTVNSTKSKLPANTDEEHVVLHFLDDYTNHVTGGKNDHKFMELEPFIDMLGKEDDLKVRLVELGKMLERAECDFTCLGDHLTKFMNDSFERLTAQHSEL